MEILSFLAACSTRLFIACFTVRFSRMIMQLVVMRLPISSSSKEAIISISWRTSSSINSNSNFFLALSILWRTSTRASVSIRERMAAPFFTSISFTYSAALSESVYSKTSDSIFRSRIRYSLQRSWTVSLGIASAMSLAWKSPSLSLIAAGEVLLLTTARISWV